MSGRYLKPPWTGERYLVSYRGESDWARNSGRRLTAA